MAPSRWPSHVRAKDLGTGREQSVTVTASSTLNQGEVERLVREAEAHAAEDRERREQVELRNQADQMVYQADKVVEENAERIPPELRSEIEARKQAVTTATKDGDANALRRAMDQFNETLQKVGQVIYQEAGASGRQGGQQGGPDDEVVDAEYREV